MAGSRASRTALFALVLLGALAAASWQSRWFGLGSDAPLALGQVPERLPDRGVQLENGSIVLTPWTTAPRGAMSAEQAIAAADKFSGHRTLPVRALKVEVATPNGWPVGTFGGDNPYRTAPDVPVWLVTYTSPKPIDASGGGLIPFYVTQFSEAVNPVTGKFLFGFETPFPCRYAESGSSVAVCEHPHTVQWQSKLFLSDGNPTILRTETIRTLGGSPETVVTLRGNFKLPRGFEPRRASYAWLFGDMGGFRVTTASQLAAIDAARRANPGFGIFPDFADSSMLCAVPAGWTAPPIAAACRTTFVGPRTIEFHERWPVYVPAQTRPNWSGWIVTLDRNDRVRSIRQFGERPPQLSGWRP